MDRTATKLSRATKDSASNKRAIRAGARWKTRTSASLKILQAPQLSALDWLVHGFSTRPGGVSELSAPNHGQVRNNSQRVLNLGYTDWDTKERVQENRRKFFAAIGAAKMRPVALRQIHSDISHVVVGEPRASTEPCQGDALITNDRGTLLIVQIADCVPILLADTTNHAIAAIHSGWRGTVQRIAAKTLGRMRMEFGTKPEDVIAAIGPAIGQCCYEVGSDVAKEFHAKFANAREWFDGPFDALASGENDPNWLPWLTMRPPGHPPPPPTVQLDLIAANLAILHKAGVPPGRISANGLCTACRSDLLFSYRREHSTGRMMAAIGITG